MIVKSSPLFFLLQPTPVILLKEGTDSSQGIPQLVSNISACQVIAEAVRTTLGPRGMDKLIVDGRGESVGFLRPGRRRGHSWGHSSPHVHMLGITETSQEM
uniref:T-complex protein 1 subunit eta n=1 Tax=Neovison vison TaxID=452646 RepID=A0A8C7A3H3_NEOVI